MVDILYVLSFRDRKGRRMNDRRTQPPLVVTVEEAAALLRVGRVKVYELIARRAIKSVRIDGCRRVVLRSLYDFIESLLPDGDAA